MSILNSKIKRIGKLRQLRALSIGVRNAAEIEQAIVSGLYSMVGGTGNLNQSILIDEIHATRPLSVIMAEQVAAMRSWAEERTVPAN